MTICALLAGCDWVMEAVTENLEIKQALLKKITPHLKPDVILTTNTSGLPIASIASVLPEALRRRWFGTHFFNPPRYMRLMEIIPTPDADPAAIEAVAHFADQRMGKEVVFARDTPNFIANRIGVFIMLEAVRLMQAEDLTIEEVDALTGTAIGWPRTGTFRLTDLVGLDVMAHVATNFARLRSSAAGEMSMPPWVQTMLERRWLGDKTKQGFYKKTRDAEGKEVRLALDWKTLEYHPAAKPKLPVARYGEERRAAAGPAAATALRRRQEGQSRALPLAPAQRALELRCRLPARDSRRRGEHRPRHASRLQLGNGAIRAVGCGGREADGCPHGDREPDRAEDARRGRGVLVSQ